MSTTGVVIPALAAAAGVALALALWRRKARADRLRRAIATLPAATRREIIGLVDRAGAEDGTPTVLLRANPGTVLDPASRIGGDPDLPLGLPWPKGVDGVPAPFLAQVRLHAPPLPSQWADRRLLVFGGAKVIALSVPPTSAPPAPAPKGVARAAPVPVGAVRLPYLGDDDGRALPPWDPAALLRRVPAVRVLLARHGPEPARLLPSVLVPGLTAGALDARHAILMGGAPQLLQRAHHPLCRDCDRPLRFLVQLGGVLGHPGKGPVVYVYGCDAHLDRVEPFVDRP